MGTETITAPEIDSPTKDDPYFYGWRYVTKKGEDGSEKAERVPLTEWDVLHPEEGDFIVQNEAHINDCHYLKDVLGDILRDRPGAKFFQDMRIDFQVGGNSILGPDLVVFENVNAPWPPERGTFPVKDMGATPIVAIEVASPSTQKLDRNEKVQEYYRVGLPLYVIVDRKQEIGRKTVFVYGYRAGPSGYVRLPDSPDGVWIEWLGIWIRSAGDRVACFDSLGQRIPERPELIEERDALQEERDALQRERDDESRRTAAEKKRADEAVKLASREKQRAEQEKQRADEYARKFAELEAELRRLRGDSN